MSLSKSKNLITVKHWAERKCRKETVCLREECQRPIKKGQIYYFWGHRFHKLIGCSPYCMDNQRGIWK